MIQLMDQSTSIGAGTDSPEGCVVAGVSTPTNMSHPQPPDPTIKNVQASAPMRTVNSIRKIVIFPQVIRYWSLEGEREVVRTSKGSARKIVLMEDQKYHPENQPWRLTILVKPGSIYSIGYNKERTGVTVQQISGTDCTTRRYHISGTISQNMRLELYPNS